MLPPSSKSPAIIKLLIQGPLCKYLRAFPSVLTIPLDSQCCHVVFRVWISLLLGRIYCIPALSSKAKMKNRLNTELTFEPLWFNHTTWHQISARSSQDLHCTAVCGVNFQLDKQYERHPNSQFVHPDRGNGAFWRQSIKMRTCFFSFVRLIRNVFW